MEPVGRVHIMRASFGALPANRIAWQIPPRDRKRPLAEAKLVKHLECGIAGGKRARAERVRAAADRIIEAISGGLDQRALIGGIVAAQVAREAWFAAALQRRRVDIQPQ